VLLGRDAETSALEELVERARGGAGSALIVHGEAGIGKTVLLAHARDSAADFTVTASGCGAQGVSATPASICGPRSRPSSGWALDPGPNGPAARSRPPGNAAVPAGPRPGS